MEGFNLHHREPDNLVVRTRKLELCTPVQPLVVPLSM